MLIGLGVGSTGNLKVLPLDCTGCGVDVDVLNNAYTPWMSLKLKTFAPKPVG